MIKAELFDLGPHNGMGEPDPTGSYWAFTVRDLGQPGDEAQALTFLVPAHQLPTDHAQAEKEALAERDAQVRAEALRELLQVNRVHRDKNWYPSLEQSILALIPSSVSEADRPTPFGLSCANYADQEGDE